MLDSGQMISLFSTCFLVISLGGNWVIIISMFFTNNPPQKSYYHLTLYSTSCMSLGACRKFEWTFWCDGVGGLPSWRPYPMYSHRCGQMSGKSESLKRSRKKTGPALASSCSCFQKSIGYPVTARPNYIFDSLQLRRARTPAWRSVWFGRSDPSIQFLLFLLHPWH